MKFINEYFEYIDTLIEQSNIHKIDKINFRKSVSFFKVTGFVSNERLLDKNYELYLFDLEIYLLFEYLSTKIFKVKTYTNWLKDIYMVEKLYPPK